MKLTIAIFVSVFCSSLSQAREAAQKAFESLVAGATHIEVCRTAASAGGYAVLFSTSDTKEIAKVMSTFQLVDPVVERTAEGEEVIKGPCFCVADYFVSFTAKDSSKKMLYLKHSLSTVLPPEPLGADYVTDMDLTKRSSKRLKQLIERLEKKPNQSPEPTPTAVTTPADAGLAPAAVVAHV